ncbi:MAG: trypsin-like peptidase domain-containing protein [Caldilineaceae bacterium]
MQIKSTIQQAVEITLNWLIKLGDWLAMQWALWLGRWRYLWRRLRGPLARGIPFYLAMLGAMAGLALYEYLTPPPEPLTNRDVENILAEAMASATPEPAYSELVYQAILPSIVYIKTFDAPPGKGDTAQAAGDASPQSMTAISYQSAAHYQQGDEDPNAEDFGLGAGVIINEDGVILTALHVVATAGAIEITFADGTETTAEIVGAEPENDIAVLQPGLLPELFLPATLGNPGAVQVGDEAYVMGHPLDLQASLSAGVISGLNRTYHFSHTAQDLTGLIQFDAAVNSGNSGGPLLNRYGQVIGIVTGLVNPTNQGVFIGVGMAVPIDVAAGGVGGGPAY